MIGWEEVTAPMLDPNNKRTRDPKRRNRRVAPEMGGLPLPAMAATSKA
jgi:hypothetical protein